MHWTLALGQMHGYHPTNGQLGHLGQAWQRHVMHWTLALGQMHGYHLTHGQLGHSGQAWLPLAQVQMAGLHLGHLSTVQVGYMQAHPGRACFHLGYQTPQKAKQRHLGMVLVQMHGLHLENSCHLCQT